MTYQDFLQLVEWGVVRVDAYYDSLNERPMVKITWAIPESLSKVLEEHKEELYIRAQEQAGFSRPVW